MDIRAALRRLRSIIDQKPSPFVESRVKTCKRERGFLDGDRNAITYAFEHGQPTSTFEPGAFQDAQDYVAAAERLVASTIYQRLSRYYGELLTPVLRGLLEAEVTDVLHRFLCFPDDVVVRVAQQPWHCHIIGCSAVVYREPVEHDPIVSNCRSHALGGHALPEYL